MYRFFYLFLGLSFITIGNAQEPLILGKVTSSSITEISGITPYSYRNGYFWVHNDSGDGANIYLIDSLASLKVTVDIEGVNAIDMEDIARFSIGGKNYLLLADIGNNLRNREILSLYVIEEPKITDYNKSENLKVPLYKEIKIQYADRKRDAEAILVDPVDQQLYIISKRDFQSTVFNLKLDLGNDKIHTLEPKIELPFTFTTAADISSDGKHIVVKNLSAIFLWERELNKTLVETFGQKPKQIPYVIEPQGEAICFDIYNRYLYTISERPFGLDSYLYKYVF
ncbi:hypothetical protein [Sphingobacterium bovistauri]|uniref:WD40-like Beta Propeller Repeat n=1 Tax=Sphingobacterium bovistauri TaxID=2781959 RepID=A0ABS7Z3Z6_9SPHI|nr:hypothetical protein [Sphingobacterium bovistauri]MCA5004865.1 hypothetical protein [Sphingobacterium bovistauri]